MDFNYLKDLIYDKSISDQDVAQKFDDFFIECDKNRVSSSTDYELDALWQIAELLRN